MTTVPATAAVAVAPRRRVSVGAFFRRPLLVIATFIIAAVTLAVTFAEVIAPYGPLEQDLLNALAAPSPEHLLGTDALGRDVLSRLLYGGQPALLGVAVAVLIFTVVGLVLGMLAGFLGGRVDWVISRLLDILLSVPAIVVIFAVLAIFAQNIAAAMAALGVLSSATLARVVRGACLAVREELYVSAAQVSGLTPGRIMARHVLPAVIGQAIVQIALFAGIALVVQTGLGFLGLATRPPAPSWGGMVGEAAKVMSQNGFFLLVTGGTIAIMTIAFGLLGDGIRDLYADSRRSSALVPRRGAPERDRTTVHAARPAGDAVLDVVDYSIAFDTRDGARDVVGSISFSVGPGEVLGLVGESGSGKTVTALSLLGLLPGNGYVSHGHAWLGDVDLADLDERGYERVRGRQIGYVSQEPMVALDPVFTIGDQLTEIVRSLTTLRGKAARERARELLTDVKLPDPGAVMANYPHELSGGMLQRVAIAVALAGSPSLLVADEPTTALDVTVQAGILDLLRELRGRGMSIILVTHDLGVVADLCDRAVVMSSGSIVDRGRVRDIFYDSSVAYTRSLIASTPSLLGRTS